MNKLNYLIVFIIASHVLIANCGILGKLKGDHKLNLQSLTRFDVEKKEKKRTREVCQAIYRFMIH
jgi:hypothetical protein